MNDKVLLFVPSLADGGGETIVKNYALLLKDSEIKPIILVLHEVQDSANAKAIEKNEIQVISIYSHWNILVRIFHKIFGTFLCSIKIKNILASRDDICAIHTHAALLKHLSPIARYLKRRNVSLVYTCHSLPKVYFSGKNKSEFYSAKKLLKHNQLKLVALHEDMKKELNSLFGIRGTIVIKNGIDIGRFRNVLESVESIRESLGISMETKLIGHIGRFYDVKNHMFLLRIFAELRKKGDYSLLLVGKGELEEAIKAEAKNLGVFSNIIFLEDRVDIERLLKAMDVLVFPSKHEGMPLTLIEAQASGKKCIISNRINPEIILSADCHMLSLEDSISNWVDAIENDVSQNLTYGNIEDYDLDQIKTKLIKLYKNL